MVVADVKTLRITPGKTAQLEMLTVGDVTLRAILQRNVGHYITEGQSETGEEGDFAFLEEVYKQGTDRRNELIVLNGEKHSFQIGNGGGRYSNSKQ